MGLHFLTSHDLIYLFKSIHLVPIAIFNSHVILHKIERLYLFCFVFVLFNFFVALPALWDLRSPSRNWTPATAVKHSILTTVDYSLLNHFAVVGHLGCFQCVTDLKNAAITIFAQIACYNLWDYFEQGHLWEADEGKSLEFSLLIGSCYFCRIGSWHPALHK